MPVIQLHTSAPIDDEARITLKTAFGQAIAAVPGKSEQWLMCLFDDEVPMYFAGDDSKPCAYLEIDVYATSEVPATAWEKLTERLTPEVSDTLGIDPARIYIRYGSTAHFGWNGTNF
ncbi:hypothetical protein H6A21_03555 [Collinsella tanakaei]|nr:phenylpyruvate tautomerase MIF-related protein [Collinsella tanakaei]MBM6867629.1 hypothetical protein [Collinsella tanakaei]